FVLPPGLVVPGRAAAVAARAAPVVTRAYARTRSRFDPRFVLPVHRPVPPLESGGIGRSPGRLSDDSSNTSRSPPSYVDRGESYPPVRPMSDAAGSTGASPPVHPASPAAPFQAPGPGREALANRARPTPTATLPSTNRAGLRSATRRISSPISSTLRLRSFSAISPSHDASRFAC